MTNNINLSLIRPQNEFNKLVHTSTSSAQVFTFYFLVLPSHPAPVGCESITALYNRKSDCLVAKIILKFSWYYSC